MAGNFWSRRLDTAHFPVQDKLYRTEPDVQVLVQSQRPEGEPRGELLMIHGLEGSGESGYMMSLAQEALEAGFGVHRFHMRTCGGTAHLCPTLYHAGLTSDTLSVLKQFAAAGMATPFLVGFSLGGNVALKLAGELGSDAARYITAVCAVSTPIDLSACARRLGKIDNRFYERRFLKRMCNRLLATGRYTQQDLRGIRSIFQIDDRITAPSFGFEGAEHYYATQSANQYLERIRVPGLIVQAKDDTFIPFEIFQHPAIRSNPYLQFIATEQGGHLGFISRTRPRFWVDGVLMDWMRQVQAQAHRSITVAAR